MIDSHSDGKRTVGYLVNSMAAGGVESQARWVVQGLEKTRYRARLAWYSRTEEFFPPPASVPSGALPRGHRLDPRFPLALAGWCSNKQVDVIHAWQPTPAFYASLIRLLPRRAPVIGAIGMSATLFDEDPGAKLLHPIAARLADHTSVNCRDVIPWLVERGISRDRITYVPNVVPPTVVDRVPATAEQKAALLRKLGLDPKRPPISQIARVDDNKNAMALLQALLTLRRAGVEVPPLLLAGRLPDDALVARLHQAARAEGYDELHVLGPVAEVHTLMEASRFTVLASLSEGMPNVVLEALGLGTLVVATRVGEVPSMVRHEVDGLLCDPGDVAGLARQLRTALSMPAQAAEDMGERARRATLAANAPAVVLAQLCDLFDEVIARARPPWLRPRTVLGG